MRASVKAYLIGVVLGLLPVLLATVPYTVLWMVFVDRPVTLLPLKFEWAVIYLLCFVVTIRGLDLGASYVLARRE